MQESGLMPAKAKMKISENNGEEVFLATESYTSPRRRLQAVRRRARPCVLSVWTVCRCG